MVARPRRGSATTGRPAEEGTITTPTAELRREPSSRAPVAEVLQSGARVEVVGERGLWVEVRGAKSGNGFVSAESVERDSDREARKKRGSKVLSFAPVFGVVAEETPIRLAPFPLSPRSGNVRRGTTIAIYGVDHAYYAFKAGDGTLAFLDSSAIDLVPRDPRQPAIVSDPTRASKDVSVSNVPRADAPTPEMSAEGVPVEPAETSDEAMEPAVLLSKVDPTYPEMARRSGVEGTVVLDAQIGANGRVEDVQVLRGLPLGLSEAAAEAVRRWQYRPARGRGGPVPSHKTVRIVFTLGR
ncbi:MAG TPA: TonB family protein [Thermoanaerobaculia bacterium]